MDGVSISPKKCVGSFVIAVILTYLANIINVKLVDLCKASNAVVNAVWCFICRSHADYTAVELCQSNVSRVYSRIIERPTASTSPRCCVSCAAPRCEDGRRANPLYLSYQTNFKQFKPVQAQKTLASAIQIGEPVSYERAVKTLQAFDGVVEQASEDELANAAVIADSTGLYACPHTGVALGVLFKLLDRGIIQRDERVIVISTAHGLKFSNFKVDYHCGGLDGVIEKHANPPIELPPDYDSVMKAIEKVGLP